MVHKQFATSRTLISDMIHDQFVFRHDRIGQASVRFQTWSTSNTQPLHDSSYLLWYISVQTSLCAFVQSTNGIGPSGVRKWQIPWCVYRLLLQFRDVKRNWLANAYSDILVTQRERRPSTKHIILRHNLQNGGSIGKQPLQSTTRDEI